MNIRGLISPLILAASAFLLLVEDNAYINEINAYKNLEADAYVNDVYINEVKAYANGEQSRNAEKQKGINPGGGFYDLPVIEPAPDFTLDDVNGNSVSLRELNGSIKIINFIYTSCPDTCSIVTRKLSQLQDTLKREGLLGERVEIISITLDPERDTAGELKYYGEVHNADGKGWLFLRGTEEETKEVLSDYDVWMKKLDDGTIDHVMRVYLVDDDDSIREIYNLAFLQPGMVLRDIETILNEKYSSF